jgi:hypothetical protein
MAMAWRFLLNVSPARTLIVVAPGVNSRLLADGVSAPAVRRSWTSIDANGAVDKRDIDFAWHSRRWTGSGEDELWATVEICPPQAWFCRAVHGPRF